MMVHAFVLSSLFIQALLLIPTIKGSTAFIMPKTASQSQHPKNVVINAKSSLDDDKTREEYTNNNVDISGTTSSLAKLYGNNLLIVHSPLKSVRQIGECTEVFDHDAVINQSISRPYDAIVELDPNQKHSVHYCAYEPTKQENGEKQRQQCGEDSICGTIYRWKKAMVRMDMTALTSAIGDDDLPNIYLHEQVLIPSGCSCLVNAANTKFADMPIVIES